MTGLNKLGLWLLGGRHQSCHWGVVVVMLILVLQNVVYHKWQNIYSTIQYNMAKHLSRILTKPKTTQSDQSLCRALKWVAKDPSFLQADSEDSDQTGRMPRLI